MLIDTHCHLDAREFDADRPTVLDAARAAGVRMIIEFRPTASEPVPRAVAAPPPSSRNFRRDIEL